MSLPRFAILLSATAALAGCCNGVATDPRAGGLAGGVCGTQTGAYDARIRERTATLQDLESTERALQQRIRSSYAEAEALGRDLGAHRARLHAALSRLSEIDEAIAQARAAQAMGEATLSRLEHRNAALRARLIAAMDRHAAREKAIRGLEAGLEQVPAPAQSDRVADESLLREIDDLNDAADAILGPPPG